jgi:hypothetical protein
METMHPAGRRSLPPVPRSSTEPSAAPALRPDADDRDSESPTERFVVDLTSTEQGAVAEDTAGGAAEATGGDSGDTGHPAEGSVSAVQLPADDAPETQSPALDPAQQFVARLRAAATDFAEAAGAESAVVREAVPPARHRRARCRLVLRYADGSQVDVTFLGPAGRPGRPSRHGLDRQIRRWLTAGQRREDAWLVTDPDAPEGLAVDLGAWAAAA